MNHCWLRAAKGVTEELTVEPTEVVKALNLSCDPQMSIVSRNHKAS